MIQPERVDAVDVLQGEVGPVVHHSGAEHFDDVRVSHCLVELGLSRQELEVRLREGLRQVRASTGTGSVNQVVEVAPWSRIPEARALFVPRDD